MGSPRFFGWSLAAVLTLMALFALSRDGRADTVAASVNAERNPLANVWAAAEAGWFYTPTTSIVVNRIDTRFHTKGAPRTVTLEVRSAGGNVIGALLRTAAFAADPSFAGFQGASFEELSLTNGTQYFIGFRNVRDLGTNITEDPGSTSLGILRYGGSDAGLYPAQNTQSPNTDPILRFLSRAVPEGYRPWALPTLGGPGSVAALWTDPDNAVFLAAGSAVAADGSTHAVFWENGAIRDLGVLGGTSAMATGISGAAGAIRVVGTVDFAAGPQGFTWENGASTLVSPNPLGKPTRVYSATEGGDPVGSLFNAQDRLRGGIWSAGGFQEFAALTATAGAEALAAEGSAAAGYSGGDAFARHACLFSTTGGPSTDLGTLGGAESLAYALSASDLAPLQVVGESLDASARTRPFHWQAGLDMRDLGTLGGDNGSAFGIDSNGNVVGRSQDGAGSILATLWPEGGAARDLNAILLDSPGDATLIEARRIDRHGFIVAGSAIPQGAVPYFLAPVYTGDPRIDSVSPAAGGTGSTGTLLVRGFGFQSGVSVNLGAGITVDAIRSSAPAIPSAPRAGRLLRISIIIAPDAAPGPRALVVTNPDGRRAIALNAFTVTLAPVIATFTLEPTTATGGSRLTGQVSITLPAPRGGARVRFTSSNRLYRPPGPVTIPRGATTLRRPFQYASRVVRTGPVTYTITAIYGGVTRSVEVTLTPRP